MNVILTIVIKTICSFSEPWLLARSSTVLNTASIKRALSALWVLASTSFSSAVLASVPCSAILLEP